MTKAGGDVKLFSEYSQDISSFVRADYSIALISLTRALSIFLIQCVLASDEQVHLLLNSALNW